MTLPENYSRYVVEKERKILGVFNFVRRVDPSGDGIPVEEIIYKESDVIKFSFLFYAFLLVIMPEYIINCIWVPLLFPFSGSDAQGKPCGWLQMRGTNQVVGFGKFKKYSLYTNLIKNRLGFALLWVLVFAFLALVGYGIIVDGMGYHGLLHD